MGPGHHPNALTMWMAGGESAELGFNVVKNKAHVHDLNATILHLPGFDHLKLTYRFQGRDYRLTDVHGNIASGRGQNRRGIGGISHPRKGRYRRWIQPGSSRADRICWIFHD